MFCVLDEDYVTYNVAGMTHLKIAPYVLKQASLSFLFQIWICIISESGVTCP